MADGAGLDAVIVDPVELSKLLFEARESLSMWADVVESRAGKPDDSTRGLIARIDHYRAERGWDPDGFGNEAQVVSDPVIREALRRALEWALLPAEERTAIIGRLYDELVQAGLEAL
jgi:hypothetical protein